jgi:predicted nucleic acid-binding protein
MRSGSITTLADTNVLVYAVDAAESAKQQRAVSVLGFLEQRRLGVITVQVLNEFFVSATRKPTPPLSPEEAGALVTIYSRTWPVLDLTLSVTLEAVRGVREYRLAYWDALVWASARLNNIPTLLTEDGPTGATIEGVRWVNPFADGFDLSALL